MNKRISMNEFLVNLDDKITLPEECPEIKDIVKIITYPKITRVRIIRTPFSDGETNYSNEVLTGSKMIIEGSILENIHYTSSKCKNTNNYYVEIPFICEVKLRKVEGLCNTPLPKLKVIDKEILKSSEKSINQSLLVLLSLNKEKTDCSP